MNWAERIAEITGSAISGSRKLGGDLGGAVLLELVDGRRIVAKEGPLACREGAMLQAMAATGAAAPQVHHVQDGLLLMAFVEGQREADWDRLAATLRKLHAPRDAPFGWDADYAFGPVTIANSRGENWPQFWAENRLLCHGEKIDGSLTARLEALAQRLPDLLPECPPASLLHGDLWGGNIVWSALGPVLIDPACYYGDREVDAAMLTLFDHPPEEFFDALDLAPGWRERQPIYRLWPLLVHLRLFGHSYRASVSRALEQIGF